MGYNQYLERLEDKILIYKKRYNQRYKKIAFKLAYWNLRFLFKKEPCPSFKDNCQHILLEISGGVGDLLINANYVNAFTKKFSSNTQIDILSQKNFYDTNKAIFSNLPINSIVIETKKNYDLHIRLVRFPIVKQFFPERVSPDLANYVEHLNQFRTQNPLACENDFFGRCYAQETGHNRENQADVYDLLNEKEYKWRLSCPENSSKILSKFGLGAKKYITLHTGAGFCFLGVKNEVRQWPIENYNQLVRMLKDRYPEYQIVQLGETHQPKIDGTDVELRGKTVFNELTAVVKNAKLHISQEGGIGILRHFLDGGKSVILFGPTDEKFYNFEENINLTMRQCPHPCEWICKDWMEKCIKTGSFAECMQRLTPQIVMNEIIKRGEL